jgi:hypothetical protein
LEWYALVGLMQVCAAYQAKANDWKNAYRWSRLAADILPLHDDDVGAACYHASVPLVFGTFILSH